VSYAALVPNLMGFERAMAAGADEVAVFASASEGFSRANLNCSIAESFDRFRPVAEAAAAANVRMRGYVSCVVECPYDGPVAPEAVADVVAGLFALGAYEVSLGDTIGKGEPTTVSAMLETVLGVAEAGRLAGHFHDTGGRALANVEAALAKGIRVFDAAVGGLGGCPFAPGAKGNVATEAVHDRLTALGVETGLDRDVLGRAAEMAMAMRHG
jgi:hydroxymethylglutaryl-CoA lyase